MPEIADDEGAEGDLAADRLILVIGGAVASDYEGSDDYLIAPVAAASARIKGRTIVWQGNSLGIDLVPERRGARFKMVVAPFINFNLNRTVTSSDPIVALITKPRVAVEGGVVVGFTRTGILTSRFDSLTVQLSGAYDLGSVHKSYVVTPSVSYAAPLSKAAAVFATAGFDVVGAGYARRYFGIDSTAGAASGLPLYRPGGGVKSASLGLGGAVSLEGDLRKG